MKRGEEREIVKKQKDEIRALESQLLEARRREVDNSLLLSRQVSNLEEKLTFERDSRLLSISELDQNKMKYDKVLKELNKLKYEIKYYIKLLNKLMNGSLTYTSINS